MKQVLKTALVGEQAKNENAMKVAERSKESINYGENPLIVGGRCRINKIYVVKDENGNIEEYGNCKKVRIEFAEDDESVMYSRGEVVHFELELLTSKTLSKLEEAILECESDEDIEMLDEGQLDFCLSNLYLSYMNEQEKAREEEESKKKAKKAAKKDAKKAEQKTKRDKRKAERKERARKQLKEKLNKTAMENATRDRESIQYELARPLLVNETTLIEAIYMIDPEDKNAYSRIVNRCFTDEDDNFDYLDVEDTNEEGELRDELTNHCMQSVSYEQAFEDEENAYESLADELENLYYSRNLPMGQYHRVVIVFKDKPEAVKTKAERLEYARKEAFSENKDPKLALKQYEEMARKILNEVPRYVMSFCTTSELDEIENLLLGCEDETDIEVVADNIN